MQKSISPKTNIIKSVFENYFFLIILATPFLEFINQNIIEFESYITLQFILLFIMFVSFQLLLMFFLKRFFNHIDNHSYKILFCIVIYLQFKFEIIKILISKLNVSYDGEIAFILIILFTILVIKLFNKLIFKNFIKIFFSLNFIFFLFVIIFGFSVDRNSRELKLNVQKNFFNNNQIDNILVKRNIYYVIVDSMTTLENFEDQYDLENKEFKNFISTTKFKYYKNTRSAYNNTIFTFTSFLNLNYMFSENEKPFLDRTKLYPAIMRPNLLDNFLLKKTLSSIGYEFKWEGSSRGNCNQYNPSLCLDSNEKTNFEKLLKKIQLNTYIFKSFFLATPVIATISRSGIERFFTDKIPMQFEENDSIGNFISKVKNYDYKKKPHFFLIHHMSPHAPYVYNKDCTRRSKASEINNKLYPSGYKEAYQCVLKKITKLINFIQDNDPKAVVIIQGDTGNSFGKNQKEKQINTTINFNLLKLNANCSKLNLSDKLDIVNGVRLALSCATNQSNNLLDKKTHAGYPKKNKNYGKVYLVENIDSKNLEEISKNSLSNLVKKLFTK